MVKQSTPPETTRSEGSDPKTVTFGETEVRKYEKDMRKTRRAGRNQKAKRILKVGLYNACSTMGAKLLANLVHHQKTKLDVLLISELGAPTGNLARAGAEYMNRTVMRDYGRYILITTHRVGIAVYTQAVKSMLRQGLYNVKVAGEGRIMSLELTDVCSLVSLYGPAHPGFEKEAMAKW